jgi:hypothetical protein
MAEMDDKGVGGGAQQPQAVDASIAAEEAAMHQGRGRMLLGIAVVIIAVIVGAVFLLMEDAGSEQYRELGKTVNGMKLEFFDGFWGCALQRVNLNDLNSAEKLVAQIEMRGADQPRPYAKHVRDNCQDKLDEMQTKLDVLTGPAELQADIAGMTDGIAKLRSSWSSYISYLDDPKLDYDAGAARSKIKEIARGWYDFKKAHAEINKKLKEKLE